MKQTDLLPASGIALLGLADAAVVLPWFVEVILGDIGRGRNRFPANSFFKKPKLQFRVTIAQIDWTKVFF